MQLENIKGIGPRTVSILNKLGIYDGQDLISYYPFRYNIIKRSDVKKLEQDDKIIIDGIVEKAATVFYFKNKKDKMSFVINTGDMLLNITIFNRGFLKSKLGLGSKITVIGKYDKKHNLVIANDMRFSLLGNKTKFEPIYHVTSGINSSQINSLVLSGLNNEEVIDYLPNYLMDKYSFPTKRDCLFEAHNPIDGELLKRAISYLKYEELFLFMLKINILRKNRVLLGLSRDVDYEEVTKLIDNLPFKLTADQLTSVDEIYNDLISEKRMNRLLQGDVGSGKTIVSFIALYINYLGGYQGALMAPTEILAKQHYNNIKKILPNLNVGLLTGKMKVKEKREINNLLKSGELDIVIGTHALVSNDVEYNNLGLVITDEQHRFGVNQRGNLKNKGIMPDILYMSATPIPRTYAITLFGDMEVSNIKTKPVGRREIKTILKNDSEMKDVLTTMYEELKNGHQAYVIAPLIEESDKIELENVNELELKMEKAFGKVFNIGVMHGKLSSKEKEEVMDKFKNNEIQILISTTVIEVGVDVANATVMVVFDSFRFGLSTLHQLRGRVGRSDLQSYFILISNQEIERLNVLVKTNDGFEISEEDFKLRGSGNLFGTTQSGDMNFKIADLKNDYKILLKARDDSMELINDEEYINSLRNKDLKELIITTNILS